MNDRQQSPSSAATATSARAKRGPNWASTGRPTQSSESEADNAGVDNEGDINVDIMTRFPQERPSVSVNTGTRKEGMSFAESKRRSAAAQDRTNNSGKDDAFVDITQQHFHEARQSFMERVNSGTMERRGTTSGQVTAGSYNNNDNDDDGKSNKAADGRNNKAVKSSRGKNKNVDSNEGFNAVAHNFSRDRDSLLGHPSRKVVTADSFNRGRTNNVSRSSNDASRNMGSAKRRVVTAESFKGGRSGASGSDNSYLDTHSFSSNLSPVSSPKKAVATNKVWRGDTADSTTSPTLKTNEKEKRKKEEEKYLDTPRAFTKNLSMVSPTIKGLNEADKFLNTNSFSWNTLSPSSPSEKKKARDYHEHRSHPEEEEYDQEQYLDKPRPFQSNVDMVSSNYSGKRFKRSSDIPPEEKNIRDGYDTGGQSSASGSAGSAASTPRTTATAPVGKRRRNDDGDETKQVFDITRDAFPDRSTLERTSSSVKDANNAVKVVVAEERIPIQSSAVDTDGDGNRLSFEEDGQRRKQKQKQKQQQQPPAAAASSYEEVMHWLLTHLPNLQEDDATSYFHSLLEDGFDNLDMIVGEDDFLIIVEEDLYFMKKGHRRALLRSVGELKMEGDKGHTSVEEEDDYIISGGHQATEAENDDALLPSLDNDPTETATSAALDMDDIDIADHTSTMPRVAEELEEKTEEDSFKAKQKRLRLFEDRFDARLTKEEEEKASLSATAQTQDDNGDDDDDQTETKPLEEMEEAWIAEQNRLAARLAKEEEEKAATNDDAYEDITRSSFVDRPSLSSAFMTANAAASASAPSTFSSASTGRNKRRRNSVNSPTSPHDNNEIAEGDEEEVFDITRDAFPDRPSLAAAPNHGLSPSLSERSKVVANTDSKRPPLSSTSSPIVGSDSNSGNSIKNDSGTPPPMQIPVAPSRKNTVKDETTKTSPTPTASVAPRAELYKRYQSYIKQGTLTKDQAQRLNKDYYTTWSKDGDVAKSHELKFTSVFTCPLTGEHFASGDWRKRTDGVGEEVEMEGLIYWYKTKKQAMNAAAARALDCFSLRENNFEGITLQQKLCEDAPYMSKDEAPSLPTLPKGVSLPTI